MFGSYDSHDVDRIERALDPHDPHLSLLTTDMDQSYALHYHRAAVLLYDGEHTLLAPFYDRQPALFGSRFFYPSWDDAIEFDMDIAEPLLDQAIRTCMTSTLPISRLDMNHSAPAKPNRTEIEQLHSQLTSA